MSINEPIPCRHGRLECECWKENGTGASPVAVPNMLHFTVSSSSNNQHEVGTNTFGWTTWGDPVTGGNYTPSVYPSVSTPVVPSGGTSWTPVNDPFALGPSCLEHEIDPESIRIEQEHAIGTCISCNVRITIPRVPGGLSFEKAGSLIGRAMTLGDEDESIGELLGELNLLEGTVNKEIARLKRSLGLVKIARDLVHNRAVKDASAPIE